MTDDPASSKGRDALLAVGCYVLWFVTVALGILDIIFLRRILLAVHVMLRLGKWWLGFADKLGVILLGLACLVFVLLAESWYRRLAAAGWRPLLERFLWVTVGQAAIVVMGWFLT
ncbi:MAG: hypothetical protein FJZ90_04570 [Chloroflexi bacterium]|nr:hypothetical protein [Chloroflexota bacterium]